MEYAKFTKCSGCIYWHPLHNTSYFPVVGECRQGPPRGEITQTVVGVEDVQGIYRGRWPLTVGASEGCGQGVKGIWRDRSDAISRQAGGF